MSTAPTLETARLRLRGFSEADLDPWAAVMADEAVMRHLGGTPQSREESWRRLLGGAGAWALLGYGYWAVERRADGALVGMAGFADFKREMQPSIEGLPEAGWIFAPAGQGQGLATEAVGAALDWADGTLPAREIAAIIAPDNAASIRVAEKSGFTGREEAQYKGEPILLFRRSRSRG
jgi:RimJ/RimL family protein N-acetyltransferase